VDGDECRARTFRVRILDFSSNFFESRNLDSGWGMIGFQFRSEFFFQRQRKPRDNFLFDTGILHEFRGFGFGILNKFISS